MPIPWAAVGDYLLPIGLGGAGAFAAFIALLPSKLGERLVGHYFEKRIADLKHDQSKELGKLQSELDHFKDRGTRSNEREYQAISQTWERFVEAFRATKASIIQFLHYPDLDRMPDDAVTSFLEANSVPETSRSFILAAANKKEAFSNYVRNKCINDAGAAIEAMRDCLGKQSVFIPADLYQQFDAALTRLHGAWAEQAIATRYDSRKDQDDSNFLIGNNAQFLMNDLRDKVRARLLRTT